MRISMLLLLSIFLLFCCSGDDQVDELSNWGVSSLGTKATYGGYDQYEWEITHDPSTGLIPYDRLYYSNQQLVSKSVSKSNLRNQSDSWEPRGPANIGGRTRAVLIDVNDPTGNTVYAGSTSGGLFKSTSFKTDNPAWKPVGGIQDNLAISAIIQDSKNPQNIYIGTGVGWGGQNDSRGFGIWKTEDGGVSWRHLDENREPAFWYVLDLVMDLHGNLYASTQNNGVQKSEDGGTTWKMVLGETIGNSDTDYGGDLEIGTDGDIYASVGIIEGGSVYKADSKEHGTNVGNPNSWQEITPNGDFRRIEIAVANSDSERIYLLCADESRLRVSNMYRSKDGGNSWQSIPVPTRTVTNSGVPFSGNVAWFALIAKVDPNNEDVLYIGGIDLIRSSDGGENWVPISNEYPNEAAGYTGRRVVHTDQHEILFYPGSSKEVIIANDGGIYHSVNVDDQVPLFDQKNQNYNTTQFYSCDLFPQEDIYIGGSQDNGNWAIIGSDLDPEQVFFLGGGDGTYVHVNQKNNLFFTIAATGIDLAVSVDGGASYITFSLPGRGAFINPYVLDDDTEIIYGAFEDDKYFVISDVINQKTIDSVHVPEFRGSQISALTPDPAVANRLWVGVRRYIDAEGFWQGRSGVFRIDNAHTKTPMVKEFSDPSWDKSLAPRNIFIDHNDSDYMLLTFSNWGSPNVWITTDGAENWLNIDGDLPDMPVRWGMINPLNNEELIIATELGVLSSEVLDFQNIGNPDVQRINPGYENGTKWVKYRDGMPNLRVNMLAWSYNGHRLVAGTWGQGIFYTKYSGPDLSSVTVQEIQGISIFPNPVRTNITISGMEVALEYYYKVYNIHGSLITQGKSSVIPAVNWEQGNYLVEIGIVSKGLRNIYRVIKL